MKSLTKKWVDFAKQDLKDVRFYLKTKDILVVSIIAIRLLKNF